MAEENVVYNQETNDEVKVTTKKPRVIRAIQDGWKWVTVHPWKTLGVIVGTVVAVGTIYKVGDGTLQLPLLFQDADNGDTSGGDGGSVGDDGDAA